MRIMFLPLLIGLPLLAAELDFKERFADPESRKASLDELIPGSRDWFFYHALDHQLSGRQWKFDETMAEWQDAMVPKAYGISADGFDILMNRQQLLLFGDDPDDRLPELIKHLGLEFNDTRPDAREAEKLPNRLDPKLIKRNAFAAEADKSHPEKGWMAHESHQLLADLDEVEDFTPERVRYYLTHLRRADHPGVVALVSRGLRLKQAIAFGDQPIHGNLSIAQMEELLVSHRGLGSDTRFCTLYIAKLREHDDRAFDRDPALHASHLARCKDFALRLPESQVSLRAHILYHHLRLQRELGNHPLEDFLKYLAIPRRNHPILRDRQRENLQFPALENDYAEATGCPPVRSDRELIDDLLLHFLAGADSPETFARYIELGPLKVIHARARLLAGASPARWGRLLEPGQFAALLEETQVDFAPGRPVVLDADDPVSLTLELKNTPELLVRLYELDLPGILMRDRSEPGPDFGLDGLVPHHSRTLRFDQHPLVRHRHTLDFPELKGPGVWIIECLSEGRACRALIRKGSLTPYVQRDADGQWIRLFNESGEVISDASFALGPIGTRFKADDSGRIRVPNSELSTSTTGVIHAGRLACMLEIGDRADAFDLATRIHLDREQLIADSRATARIQVQLNNRGHALPIERLDDASLTLSARLVGDVTTKHITSENLELAPAFEIPFQVPAGTIELTLKLAGTIIPRDGAEPVTLESFESFTINSLLHGRFAHGYMSLTPEGHVLEVRGRNGEPLPNRAIECSFNHRDFKRPIRVTTRLRSDENGRLVLGRMDDIDRFEASHAGKTLVRLRPSDLKPLIEFGRRLRVAEGEEIRIASRTTIDRSTCSLVELDLQNRPRADHFDKLAANGRQVTIEGLAAGTYRLEAGSRKLLIEVEDGEKIGDFFVSSDLIAPRIDAPSAAIDEIRIEGDRLLVKTVDATPETRIHLVAGRYLHPWNQWRSLAPLHSRTPPSLTPGFVGNAYLTERRLSDEMEYILRRRAVDHFPGSMLPRPGLLANRWSDQDIDADRLPAIDGSGGLTEDRHTRGRTDTGGLDPFGGEDGGGSSDTPDFLDYISRSSELDYDLVPGEDGLVSVPVAKFEGCQLVHIVLTDQASLQRHVFPLPENPVPLRDRRLSRPLDSRQHHIGTRSAAALARNAEATIENVLSADWRAFTTLTEAHEFLYGATGSEHLRELSFLLDWPELEEDEKLRLWSDHAGHEFHLFVARKDPKFFKQYVEPLLREKHEPTFIDDLLLERNLGKYFRPFAWQRLNAAEKALLVQAVPDARKRIATELGDRWELEQPAPEQVTRLFTQTLRGTDLATRDSLGLARRGVAPSDGGSALGANVHLQKLRNLIVPIINFEDTSLEDAIEFLRARSIALDTMETDPLQRGIRFVIRQPRGSSTGSIRIPELRLRNVPLAEVLNYICEATRMRWTVDDHAVTIRPATETGEDLFTRTFNVPPDFVARISEPADLSIDPFGAPIEAHATRPRMSLIDALKNNGVKFPPGATAIFNTANSTLTVRNTPSNLDYIDSMTRSVHSSGPIEEEEGEQNGGGYHGAGLLSALEADPFAAPGDRASSDARFQAKPSWSARPGQTRLWQAANYYRHRGDTDERLIPLNAFWLDLAGWDGEGRFLSPHFNACTHNANEALMCLALLDLPFKAGRPQVEVDGSRMKVKAREPMLLFYEDTRTTDKLAPDAPVLVRQTFHRLDNRFRREAGREIENTITGEFQAGVAYGSSLVVTNPSGAGRRIDVLAQIPAGAIALAAKPTTLAETRELPPYGVITFDMAFYFPAPGDFPIYPMHVSERDTILASAPARTLRVNESAPDEDRSSWPVVARDGTDDEVLTFLRSANLHAIEPALVRWRLRDRTFFLKATEILQDRLVQPQEVSAYGFHHGHLPTIRTWLENSRVRTQLGSYFDNGILKIDPVEHLDWETLEFDPLINPRAHHFGNHPRLSHPAALEHYEAFLEQLSWKSTLSANDQLQFCWFLFLQDRVAEGIQRFEQVDPEELHGRLAYDYLETTVRFHQGEPEAARRIALGHRDLPPGPWKERFDAVIDQSDEIASFSKPGNEEVEKDQRVEPSLDLALERDGRLRLEHRHLAEVDLKLYHIDLEMLFSKNPFLHDTNDLPGTRPNLVKRIALKGTTSLIELPEGFRRGNLLVAADAGTTRILRILGSQAIRIERDAVSKTIQILDASTGTPVPGCYVKIFSDDRGRETFHKDGYSDLRGMFDYLNLSDGEIAPDGDLAIFVDHPDKGSRTMILER